MSKKKPERHYSSNRDDSKEQQNPDVQKKAPKLSDKDLQNLKQEGFKQSKAKESSFKEELKQEYKNDNHKIPLWGKIAIPLVVCGLLFGGTYGYQYYQTHWSQQATGRGATQEQQQSFVNMMRKYMKANWRPVEMSKAIDKKYSQFSYKNQIQLSYLLYRSQQNTALYYNSYLYFMQAEFDYYDLNGTQANPLKPNAKTLGSTAIPAEFNDIRNNHEFLEYTGENNFTVLPDFNWVANNYKTEKDLKSFLQLAGAENTNPIFKYRKVNIPLAYKRLQACLSWVYRNPNSAFRKDAMSLAKFYYQSIFQLNTDWGLTRVGNNYKLSDTSRKQLESITKKGNPFYSDLHAYLNSMKHDGYVSPALRVSYETLSSSYFGDSVFDSMSDSIGGAPKMTQKTPNSEYTPSGSDITGNGQGTNSGIFGSIQNNEKESEKNNANKSSTDKTTDRSSKQNKSKNTNSKSSKNNLKSNSKGKSNAKLSKKEVEKIRAQEQHIRDEINAENHGETLKKNK